MDHRVIVIHPTTIQGDISSIPIRYLVKHTDGGDHFDVGRVLRWEGDIFSDHSEE